MMTGVIAVIIMDFDGTASCFIFNFKEKRTRRAYGPGDGCLRIEQMTMKPLVCKPPKSDIGQIRPDTSVSQEDIVLQDVISSHGRPFTPLSLDVEAGFGEANLLSMARNAPEGYVFLCTLLGYAGEILRKQIGTSGYGTVFLENLCRRFEIPELTTGSNDERQPRDEQCEKSSEREGEKVVHDLPSFTESPESLLQQKLIGPQIDRQTLTTKTSWETPRRMKANSDIRK
jgi:hypothetical protein